MMMLRPLAKRSMGRKVKSFMKDDSGVMAPQILFFMVIMLLVGGIAVDVMRFETKRVALQQTMDRAVLAAASLENTLEPQDVVNSYIATSGIDATLSEFTVVQTVNGRTVRARATAHSDNIFMSMMDVPYLQADNRSQAEQRINDIEIMLVLDVSGSMGGAKLANLKIAANDFIDTITENDPEGRISIGIIPYNAQVNLGAPLRARFNAQNLHGVANANCLELPSNVFGSLALSKSTPLPMMAVADAWTSTSTSNSYQSSTGGNATPDTNSGGIWCSPSTDIDVTLPTKNKTTLHAAVNSLEAGGNTSIMLGMRWATALLDPSMRSDYNAMISAGAMPSDMSGRPYNYDNSDAMKVVVLMTDGQHVAHTRVTDDFKTGPSGIFRSSSGNNYSRFFASKVDSSTSTKLCQSRPFYVPHLNAWHSRPWNGSTPASNACYSPTAVTSSVTALQWQDVWADLRVSWVAWQLYARPLGGSSSSSRNWYYNEAMGSYGENNAMRYTYQSVSEMDNNLSINCAAARQQNVLIYGIAFEAPTEGQTAIRDCASKPSSTFYFPANGLDIQTAFQMIAANLSQLRLTQ